MTEEVYIQRGEVVCKVGELPSKVGVRLRANLFWLGNTPLQEGRFYHFKCGTQKVSMTCEKVIRVVNASDLDQIQRSYVEKHEVAECIFDLDSPAVFDTADTIASQGRFVIVDGYEQAGGGIILERLDSDEYDRRNIRWSHGSITRPEREKATGCKGLVVWMTGLSGAGKTTIAQNVERSLLADGIPTYLLDGDRLRRGLNADLGFTDEDRMENQRRVAEVAALFRDSGMVTLVSTISPYQSCRDLAREKAEGAFLEVYVKADFETCMHRDPKQLYHKATAGGIANFTGMGSRYEEPTHPDLVLNTQELSEEAATTLLLETIHATLKG
jgi:bifunctional enzyme CysN/CysC